jgi:hypothetical protein
MENNPINSNPNQLLATPLPPTITLTPDQIKASLQQGLAPRNKYLTFLMNFSPRNVGLNEFNPIYDPQTSVPALLISTILLSYYKRKYFIIGNTSIPLFSLITNYCIYYYLIVNGRRFYEYYKGYDFNKVNETPLPLL